MMSSPPSYTLFPYTTLFRSLASGETNLCTDIGLFRPACLGDFVWDDFNRNGVQDAGEPGITNVTLQLQSCTSTSVVQIGRAHVCTQVTDHGRLPSSARVKNL